MHAPPPPGSARPDLYARIAQQLPALLKKAQFDPSPYAPRDRKDVHGYGKLLLGTLDGRLCVQVFGFGPEQATPIHDHPCRCTSVVAQGTVTELRYDETGRVTQSETRGQGSVGSLTPGNNDIHSLRTQSGAVTVHLYAIDGVQHTAAVKKVYSTADWARTNS